MSLYTTPHSQFINLAQQQKFDVLVGLWPRQTGKTNALSWVIADEINQGNLVYVLAPNQHSTQRIIDMSISLIDKSLPSVNNALKRIFSDGSGIEKYSQYLSKGLVIIDEYEFCDNKNIHAIIRDFGSGKIKRIIGLSSPNKGIIHNDLLCSSEMYHHTLKDFNYDLYKKVHFPDLKTDISASLESLLKKPTIILNTKL